MHNGIKNIETERLLLRPFVFEDCNDMLDNWIANIKVQSEYGEPVYTSVEEVSKLLNKWIDRYNHVDFYRWAIIEKQSNKNIGQIAFCRVYQDCKTVEIEYCIGECFWGNGYASEAVSSIIEYTFSNTDFIKLEAFHRKENFKSSRVLEKSTMYVTDNIERFIRENVLPNDEVCYAIKKEDWLSRA